MLLNLKGGALKWILNESNVENAKENVSEHSTTLKVSDDILNRKQK